MITEQMIGEYKQILLDRNQLTLVECKTNGGDVEFDISNDEGCTEIKLVYVGEYGRILQDSLTIQTLRG